MLLMGISDCLYHKQVSKLRSSLLSDVSSDRFRFRQDIAISPWVCCYLASLQEVDRQHLLCHEHVSKK